MNYFAYAAHLNQKEMRQRCPDSNPLFTATLPNYKLIFLGWSREWHGATASIRVFRGEKVRGAVYDVSEQCLRQLDKFEVRHTYTRLNVTVFDEDNQPVVAITYVRDTHIPVQEAEPSPEYLAIIQQGYKDWRLA
jgi:gamma-glutamylcyclotransferase